LGALDDLEPPQVAAYLEKATLKPPPEVVEVPAPTPGAGVDDAKISALIARIDALEKREAEMRAQLEQANAYLDTLPARDSIPLPIERSGDLSVPPPPIQQAQAVDDQELLPPPVENLGNLLDDAVRKGDFDRSIEIPGTDISLRVGGRFKLDANVGKVDGGDSESNLGANASRVSVFAQKPTDFGRAGGFLEADFAGGRARIRHGYAQLGPVLAGLTWSNFSHLAALPSTVAVDPVGTVARRVPQLRWSWTGDEREFALALENASPDLALGVDDRARRKLPDLTGHVRFTRPASDVQVGGILRTLEYDGPGRSGDATGWGISLSASLPNGETDRAVLGALYGEGIGSYVIGLSGSLVDAVVTAEGGLRAIEAYGGYLGYEHRWSGEWRSTFMASYVERERDSLLDSIRAATSATLNVIWNPFPGFGVGAELLLGREEDAFGVERDERRLFLAVQYGF
ncbi:MAG: DcaP family trimeric outer membrane transporter, partial [Acidobacteriota bacterium]